MTEEKEEHEEEDFRQNSLNSPAIAHTRPRQHEQDASTLAASVQHFVTGVVDKNKH